MELAVDSRKYGIWLWILTGLFAIRVLGQLLQWQFFLEYLPDFEVWASGVVPYRFLLAAQLAILGCYAWVAQRYTRRKVQFSPLAAGV